MSTKAQREIAHRLKVFAHAEQNGNVALIYRYFDISRDTFYRWKKNYKSKGEIGLVNSKPCPQNPKLRTPIEIEEKIIHLRQHYHFGQLRISWYLWRYHQIKISAAGVSFVMLCIVGMLIGRKIINLIAIKTVQKIFAITVTIVAAYLFFSVLVA